MTALLTGWLLSSWVVILAVLALRAALGRRLSARVRYALWAVVLARLLIPVQLFPSPVAVTAWTPQPPAALEEQTLYAFPVSRDPVEDASNVSVQADGTVIDSNSFGYVRVEDGGAALTRYAAKLSPVQVLELIWLGGGCLLLAVMAWANLRFYRRLRRVRRPLDGERDAYAAEGLPSPCLFGLFRPKVYVTPQSAADPKTLRHVLVHERVHRRHGDHVWGALRCLALAVHWWNPLVWLAAVLSRRDGELACDEAALDRLGDGERRAYGETLLCLAAASARPGNALLAATTMTGGKRSLAQRLRRIARRPRQLVSALLAAVLLMSLTVACAFGRQTQGPFSGAQALAAELRPSDIAALPDAPELSARELANALNGAVPQEAGDAAGDRIFFGEQLLRLTDARGGGTVRLQPARNRYLVLVTYEREDGSDSVYVESEALYRLLSGSGSCRQYIQDHPDSFDSTLQDYLLQLREEDLGGASPVQGLTELLHMAAACQSSRTYYAFDQEAAGELSLASLTIPMADGSTLVLAACGETVYICRQTAQEALAAYFDCEALRQALLPAQLDLSEVPLMKELFASIQASNITQLEGEALALPEDAQRLADTLNRIGSAYGGADAASLTPQPPVHRLSLTFHLPAWSSQEQQLVLEAGAEEDLVWVQWSGYQVQPFFSSNSDFGGTYLRDVPGTCKGAVRDETLYDLICGAQDAAAPGEPSAG